MNDIIVHIKRTRTIMCEGTTQSNRAINENRNITSNFCRSRNSENTRVGNRNRNGDLYYT